MSSADRVSRARRHHRSVGWLIAVLLLGGHASGQGMLLAFDGSADYDFFGIDVDGGGDVDGDGHPDVVVGALGLLQGGRAEVYSGATGALLHVLPAVWFRSCALAGDVDGDGHCDVMVGETTDAAEVGRVTVYSGATGAVIHTFLGSAEDDLFGEAVAGGGDVDGDGFADLVVGAPQRRSFGTGYVRVFSGRTGALLHQVDGPAPGDRFGTSVARAGDVDSDGLDDWIAGGPGHDAGGTDAGIARVFSGASGLLLHEVIGSGQNAQLGHSVAGAGDLDGDGFGDWLVGAPGDTTAGAYAGAALVLSGQDGSLLVKLLGAPFRSFGSGVAGVGDVDRDGIPDLAVRSPGQTESVAVFSGAGFGRIFALSSIHVSDIAGAGDVDGDGQSEVILGDPIENAPERGRAEVWTGPGSLPASYCTAKVNSQGCSPEITATGTPSASAPGPFLVGASRILNRKAGLLFYGKSGPAAVPFQGGVLCVAPPTVRTPVQFSGGNPPPADCSGSFSVDFNAWIQAGSDPALEPGLAVRAQHWYRDPAASFGSGLSDALSFVIGP